MKLKPTKPTGLLEDLTEGNINTYDLAVYHVLQFLCDTPKSVTLGKIMKLAHVSNMTAQRSLKRLEKMGWITIEREFVTAPGIITVHEEKVI